MKTTGIDDISSKLSDRAWRLNNIYYIKDKEGARRLFVPNWAQQQLLEGLHTCNIILKARQLGITTFFALLFLDHCLWNSDINAAIVADRQSNSQEIFKDKVKYAYDHLPPAIKELSSARRDSAQELRFNNGSVYRVGTSLRGGTCQLLHVCLSGNTKVVCKNGTEKFIKDIHPGDLVLTGSGGYQKVGSLIKNELSDLKKRMVEVEIFGSYENLRLTEDHRLLCRVHKTGAPIWKNAGDIKDGEYVAYPIREISNNLRTGKIRIGNEWILPNYDFGWMCGLYIAEGDCRRTEVVFSLHQEEVDVVVDKLKCIETLYKNHTVYFHKNSRTAVVRLNTTDFSYWLVEQFGTGCINKIIPDKVWKWGAEFCRGLLAGYFYGDGCYKDVTCVKATSVSKPLINQLKLLLISLRYGFPSIYFKRGGVRYGRSEKDAWTIALYGAGNWKWRKKMGLELPTVATWTGKWRLANDLNPNGRKSWRRGAKYYWARVTNVSYCEDETFVYDLALANSPHNYVTTSGIVHNSEYGKICREFPSKATEIMTGALNTVQAGQVIAIESTAEGREGHFYDLVQRAQEHQDRGDRLGIMDYKLFFFPWWKEPAYALV